MKVKFPDSMPMTEILNLAAKYGCKPHYLDSNNLELRPITETSNVRAIRREPTNNDEGPRAA